MNRLFITTVCGFLLALAASSAASYWLALNPPFQLQPDQMTDELERIGEQVFSALDKVPEQGWDDRLSGIEGIDNYYVEWFDAFEYEAPVELQATLASSNRVLSYLIDGTPMLEILFDRQRLVLELVPIAGYDKRFYLNGASTVGAVLFIGIVASLLTLVPIAKRLGKLQWLAGAYSTGDFSRRNTDDSADAIGKLGQSMESMADQVQGLLKDKEQLVGDQQELMRAVAHEFRAPMARMRFALEMHEDLPTRMPTADENKQEISTALDELDSLVTEVLRYSRLQRSAPELATSKVKLIDVVTESVAAVQAINPAVPVQLNLHCVDIEVAVDSLQFQRALRNLISNALKYTQSQVLVRSECVSDSLLIHIDDNGPGIDAQHRKRILNPFVRIDSSRTRSEGGTGLGLAIANGVITKHGGELVVGESPEGGARFTMCLPL